MHIVMMHGQSYKKEANMTTTSRHGVIEEIRIMINTGASEDAVDEYIINLYTKGEITSRVYELLMSMNYCR